MAQSVLSNLHFTDVSQGKFLIASIRRQVVLHHQCTGPVVSRPKTILYNPLKKVLTGDGGGCSVVEGLVDEVLVVI